MADITHFIIILFKSMEWFFWSAVIVCGFHLVFTRTCFKAMIRFINWMFRLHDFDGQIAGNARAFDRYRRDMGVLFALNLVVVGLIHII